MKGEGSGHDGEKQEERVEGTCVGVWEEGNRLAVRQKQGKKAERANVRARNR